MKRIFALLTVLLLAQPLLAGEFLVKYKDGQYQSMFAMKGFSVRDTHDVGNLMKIKVPDFLEMEVIANLYASGNIEYVVPNVKVYAISAPVEMDTLKEQWHIAKIGAEAAWKKAGNRGSRNVKVAVIDTGVDYNHESLKPNMIEGYDFRQNDKDPMDITSPQNPGHGTHCAGIIGGTGLVSGGIVGMSPEVSIMPIRFLGEDGSGDLNGGIKSIDYAIENGAHVISASWGAAIGRSQAAPLIEAVKRATDKGVIFVAAASNDGRNNDSFEVYPANANLPNFMSVAASGPNDEKPQWSNYGRRMVHLASPGLNIMSTVPKNKYSNMSGTSMATPLVSGLVAFLKSQDMSLTGEQVKAILQTTGAKVAIETQCNCRIDASAATDMVLNKDMYLVPAAGTFKAQDTFKIEAINAQGSVVFKSSNESVMTVDANGNVTAVADGETVISATDAAGKTVSTLTMYVGSKGGGNDPGQPGEPGMPGECPFQNEQLCQIVCQIMPQAPWCNQR